MVKLSELTTFKEIISQFLVLADLESILLLLILNSSTISALLERIKKKTKTKKPNTSIYGYLHGTTEIL